MASIPFSNIELDGFENLLAAMADAIGRCPRCVCPEPAPVNVIDDEIWGCVICDGLILDDNPLEGFAS